jgi:hypothetical protein
MPQAARFECTPIYIPRADREPYQVFELTTALADIEWHVELANFKGVKTVVSGVEIDPNTPGSKAMSTRDANCADDLSEHFESPGFPPSGGSSSKRTPATSRMAGCTSSAMKAR